VGVKLPVSVRALAYGLVVSTDAPVIQQAFRFALDPTAEQERFLAACAGASRFWFNQGLALVKDRLDRRAAGEDVDVPWSYRVSVSPSAVMPSRMSLRLGARRS
jgi:Helix-turn-helix domain